MGRAWTQQLAVEDDGSLFGALGASVLGVEVDDWLVAELGDAGGPAHLVRIAAVGDQGDRGVERRLAMRSASRRRGEGHFR